ncbi:bolA-like protein DDB_G0274169 [Glandiceps talaboti]
MSLLGKHIVVLCRNNITHRLVWNVHSNLQVRPAELLTTSRKMSSSTGPVQAAIIDKLTSKLQPVHLEVINESYMHNVPKGSETHFKVVIVSNQFDKQTHIKRHRMVNEVLKDELSGPVHALSIQAKTSEQWNVNTSVTKSPPCLGGMKKEANRS